jgi:hypothetical protein
MGMNQTIENIQVQLDEVIFDCTKIEQALLGTEITAENRKWFASAKAALRIKKQQKVRLYQLIADIRKEDKKAATAQYIIEDKPRQIEFCEAFKKCARFILSEDQFMKIADMANEMISHGGEK